MSTVSLWLADRRSVGVITAAPPEAAGVTSGLLQVAFQAGSSIALAIQAGLMTTREGGTSNWTNVQVVYWFMLGWAGVFTIVFLALYRPLKRDVDDLVLTRVH